MMSDYERVIELQEIAERSQGATVAQMATYMEGMEASLNKITVAWEKTVSALVNNDLLISGMSLFGDILDTIGNVMSTLPGSIVTFTVLGTLALSALNNKRIEMKLSKENLKMENQRLITERLSAIQTQKTAISENLVSKQKKTQAAYARLKLAYEKGNTSEIKKAQKAVSRAEKAEDKARAKLTAEQAKQFKLLEDEEGLLNRNAAMVGTLQSGWLGVKASLGDVVSFLNSAGLGVAAIVTSMKKIVALKKTLNAETVKATILQGKENIKLKAAALWHTAIGAAKKYWPVALGLLAIGGLAIGAVAAAKAYKEGTADKIGDDINKASNEIYKLQKENDSIKQTVSSFNDLDKKVIKTTEDLEEMNSILEKGRDLLSEDKQKLFDSLDTEGKIKMLEDQEAKNEEKIKEKDDEIRRKFLKAKGKQWNTLAYSNEDKYVADRASVYASNNRAVNDYIESAGLSNNTGKLAREILGGYDFITSFNIFKTAEKQTEEVASLIKKIGDNADVLYDNDASILEKIKAYNNVKGLGGVSTLFSDIDAFSQMAQTSDGEKAIQYIDDMRITTAKLAEMGKDFGDNWQQVLKDLANGISISDIIKTTLGVDKEDEYNEYVNKFQNLLAETLLNIGQNVEKFKSSVSSFYSKATSWNTLKDSEKTAFISENADLFKQEGLLDAFESGDYNLIEKALSQNKYLVEQRNIRLREINQALLVEEAKVGDERNEAFIKQLKNLRNHLLDERNLYKASLDDRIKQEEAVISRYKEMLQKEQDALQESLDDRKKAYEDYFAAINEEASDEEYEEKANTLISNLSKLGASTNADAVKQAKDLENQLKQLESDRLKELRERAQEQVLSNIDDEIQQISDKFDKLIDSNRELLAAFIKDGEDTNSLLARAISGELSSGNLTANGFEEFLSNLRTDWSSHLTGVNWDAIGSSRIDEHNNLILNVNGQEVVIPQDSQQNLYVAIMDALRQIGIN